MQIYIALISLQNTCRKQGISLFDAVDFVSAHGFKGMEILDRDIQHLDRGHLKALRKLYDVHGCGVILDANCDLTVKHDSRWRAEISHVRKMLDSAHILASPVLRITLGGQSFSVQKLFNISRSLTQSNNGSGLIKRILSSALSRRIGYLSRARFSHRIRDPEAKISRALEAVHEILPRAEQYEIRLAIENHWGISSQPERVMRIVDDVNSPWLGTCPDFGNFPRQVDRYEGLRILAPKAFNVQAKSWSFDRAGNERTIDYRRCFDILEQSGYDGTVSIEYEGGGDELTNCMKTRDLINRVSSVAS